MRYITQCFAFAVACPLCDWGGSSPLGRSTEDGRWMETDVCRPLGSRAFSLLPYMESVSGVVATRDTWETEGYENTYAVLVEETTTRILGRCMRAFLKPDWRVTTEQIVEGLALVPARLQKDWDAVDSGVVRCTEYDRDGHVIATSMHRPGCFDRVHCTFEAQGRTLLLTLAGQGRPPLGIDPPATRGIAVSLSSAEIALRKAGEISALQECLNDLLHELLVDDPRAPYAIELTRRQDSEVIEVRGRQMIEGWPSIPDTDTNPSHWMSALAGIVKDDKFVFAVPGYAFYYVPEENVRISRPLPPSLPPHPGHAMDTLLGRRFWHDRLTSLPHQREE